MNCRGSAEASSFCVSPIYVINVDGSNRRQLTNNSDWEGEASWSPDGTKIAYNNGNADIWVMDADGKNPVNLTSQDPQGSRNNNPDWSPDGTKIAFCRYSEGKIYIMNADGSNPTFITNGGYPRWSPDGTKITFYGDRGHGGYSPGIFIINSDGSKKTLLAPTPSERNSNADDHISVWQPLPYNPPLLHAIPISGNNLQLSWDKSPNAQAYRLQRKLGDCNSTNAWATRVDVGPNVTSFGEDTGLQSNTPYSYQIAAYYGSGSFSDYSACVSATTSAAGAPNMPSSLKWLYPDRTTAQSLSSSEVLLGWDDDSADESGFVIYRKTGTGGWAQVGTTEANTQAYTDTSAAGNTDSTSYAYDVRACNATGCSKENPYPPVVPFAPTNLAATVGTAVSLAWHDASDNETGFEVSRKNGACNAATPWTVVAKPTANAQGYADANAVSKEVYAYRVRAVYDTFLAPRSLGYSGYSNCVSAAAP